MADNDLSGLDVMVHEVPHKTSMPESVATQAQPKSYNLTEVASRWGCTKDSVLKQVSNGFPLKKMSNGHWHISEYDLLKWEAMRRQQRIEKERSAQRNTIIMLVFVTTALIIALVVLWPTIEKFLLNP